VRDWLAKGALMPRRFSAVTSAAGRPSSANVRSAAGAGAESAAVSARSSWDGARWRIAGAAARPEVRRRGDPLPPLVLRLCEEDALEGLWDTAARGRRTCSGKEELHQRSSAATCFARRGTQKARKASSESSKNQRPRGPLARGSGETTGLAIDKAISRPGCPPSPAAIHRRPQPGRDPQRRAARGR